MLMSDTKSPAICWYQRPSLCAPRKTVVSRNLASLNAASPNHASSNVVARNTDVLVKERFQLWHGGRCRTLPHCIRHEDLQQRGSFTQTRSVSMCIYIYIYICIYICIYVYMYIYVCVCVCVCVCTHFKCEGRLKKKIIFDSVVIWNGYLLLSGV